MTTSVKTTPKSEKKSKPLTDAEKQLHAMPGEIDPNVRLEVIKVVQKAKSKLNRR